jgi:hypothetical protein
MIKNDRFYVYGEHTILNPYKQKWKGRFYKKLHGDKCGWSFPIEFRAVIDNLLESQPDNTEPQSSDTEPQSSTESSDTESQPSIKSSNTEPQSSTKSSDTEPQSNTKSSDTESKSSVILFQEQESNIKEWDIDIPIEVYDFFKKYLN